MLPHCSIYFIKHAKVSNGDDVSIRFFSENGRMQCQSVNCD